MCEWSIAYPDICLQRAPTMSRLPLLFSWGQTAKVYHLLQETRSSFHLKVGIMFCMLWVLKNISFTFKHPRLLGFASPSFFSYSVDPVGPNHFVCPDSFVFLVPGMDRKSQAKPWMLPCPKGEDEAFALKNRRMLREFERKSPTIWLHVFFWACFFQRFLYEIADLVGWLCQQPGLYFWSFVFFFLGIKQSPSPWVLLHPWKVTFGTQEWKFGSDDFPLEMGEFQVPCWFAERL